MAAAGEPVQVGARSSATSGASARSARSPAAGPGRAQYAPMLQGEQQGVGLPSLPAASQHAGGDSAPRALLPLPARLPHLQQTPQRAQPAHGAAQRTGLRREGDTLSIVIKKKYLSNHKFI